MKDALARKWISGTTAAILTDLAATTSGDGAAMVGFKQSGTGATSRDVEGKFQDTVSVFDFIPKEQITNILAGTSAFDATAYIQNAIDTGKSLYFPGSRAKALYFFTHLTMPDGQIWYGDGPYSSVLRQLATVDVDEPAITITGLNGGNIADNPRIWSNIGLEIKSKVAVHASNCTASLMRSNNLRIQNQHSETLGAPPYTVVAGSKAFEFDGTSASIFLSKHTNIEIRSFETAVSGVGSVSDHYWHGWFLDCKYGFDLTDVPGCNISVAYETGVPDARPLVLRGGTSNIYWQGGRWELTQAGGYGVEFVAGFTGYNISVVRPNVLITGDGSALPGRKWIGTPPGGFMLECTFLDTIDGGLRNAMICPAQTAVTMPNFMRVGGSGKGNGSINLGRDADNAAVSRVYHDGTHFNIMGGNSLRLYGDGQTGANFKIDVNSTGVGFNGVAGVARQTASPVATDLASVITLANNLRSILNANGLAQ